MKRIRVLEAIRQGSVGGGETHVFDLSTRLNKDLFEPIVLSFTDGPMVENLRAHGIETHVIHSRFPFDPRVFIRVHKLIKEKQIDIVHAHGTRAASNLLFPAWINKIKLIYTVHGWSFNDNQSRFVKFIRQAAELFITQRASLNICVSESNRLTGKAVIADFNAVVINNGISLDKFNKNVDNSKIISELNKKQEEV
jgi:glycosyltransferase involved in cell wall biosynthesis